MPEISIILPVKNASSFIEKTILSIQSQSFKYWELIVVNDHSIDSTPNLINWFAKNDNRIKYFEHTETGIIPALQRGLKEATGTYITRIDADDLMPPNRLKTMLNAFAGKGERTIITGLVSYFSDDAISDGYIKYEDWLNSVNRKGIQWKNVYRECVVASPNWMIRRNDLQAAGGFDELCYPEDYHLVLRWYQNGFQIHCVPEVTLLWREHPDRTSRTSDNYSQQAFFELKISEFLRYDLKSDALVLWGTNEKGRLTADVLISHSMPFHWMDLRAKSVPLKGRPVGHYTAIEKLQSPQLLIAVYPEEKERDLIISYLHKQHLKEGEDWWWL